MAISSSERKILVFNSTPLQNTRFGKTHGLGKHTVWENTRFGKTARLGPGKTSPANLPEISFVFLKKTIDIMVFGFYNFSQRYLWKEMLVRAARVFKNGRFFSASKRFTPISRVRSPCGSLAPNCGVLHWLGSFFVIVFYNRS